jgi:tetratricopeptide (TPR) repeat protein
MKKLYISAVCLCLSATVLAQADSARAYYQKGREQESDKRYAMASINFNKAIAFDPKYKEAYLQDAYVNMEMVRTDKAKADFEKVYELDPNDQHVIKALTMLYYDYHQYKLAILFANKCTTCDNAERIIAMSNYEQENYEEAISGLQGVIEENPADAEATYTIARSYLELEEYVKAVPYYQKAIELYPKNTWLYELGLLYYTNEDYKDAVVLFDKAAAAGYNQSSDYKENLGFACVYSGDFARGEKILLALLALRPTNKDLLRGIADAYYSHKMYDRSLQFCQQLLTLDARDGRAMYRAGMCFQKKGDKEKGQQMCDEAIQIDPSLANLKQKGFSEGL